jgi:hypothetical protein
MSMVTHILAQAARTERIEDRFELLNWSADNPLLIGGALSLAGLYLVFWLYGKEGRGRMNRSLRWSLITCRVLVLVLIGLIGLEPVLVRYIHRRVDAYTLVLVDESASMSLRDSYRVEDDAARVKKLAAGSVLNSLSREDYARRLTEGESGIVAALARQNPVKVFSFSDGLSYRGMYDGRADAEAVTTAPATTLAQLPLDPTGPVTDVSAAIRGALDSVAGAPTAGVVVLSDGGFNHGESTGPLAELLRSRGSPLHAIGVGDPAKPVNAQVVSIQAPRSAFKNDPFSVTVEVRAEGLDAAGVRVDLLERFGDAEPSPVDSKTAAPRADGGYDKVVFERKVSRPGAVSYIARIETLPDESVVTDNQKDLIPAMQVLDDQMRVLVVAGGPSYDYRYLVRMLERDSSVNVSTWLQSADVAAVRDGDTIITELPTRQEELFRYDAIVLIDVDPDELPPTWAAFLVDFVSRHGGGLLLASGHKFTSKFFRTPKVSSIIDILPVVPDPDAEILINDEGQYQLRAWPLIIPDAAIDDPILRQAASTQENFAIWNSLEGVYWHYPVRREKPVATILMRHADPRMQNAFGQHVLMATQLVGTGRTAFLGFNSTWRWRRDDEKSFNRFWIQLLRFLVEGKLTGAAGRGVFQLSKEQYQIGESVVITVRALDAEMNPLTLPELDLKVIKPAEPSSSSLRLSPILGRDGYYQGRLMADRLGSWALELTLPATATDAAPPVVRQQFNVSQPDLEMRDTAMNRAALQELAARSGGQYFDVDQADRAAEAIPDGSRRVVAKQPPRPLWDNGYVLSLLVGLLMIEWILRKKARLL